MKFKKYHFSLNFLNIQIQTFLKNLLNFDAMNDYFTFPVHFDDDQTEHHHLHSIFLSHVDPAHRSRRP